MSNDYGDRRFSTPADVDEFIATLERYERGELSTEEFRAFRLVRGVYGQRQDDAQMIRVKIPQGILLPDQLEALAEVAEETPRKLGHLTTRQNVQFHFLKMAEVEGLLRRLDRAGITTRAACGNSVRNITGCPHAGLSRTEPFDTTPFGDALVRYLLRQPFTEALPRKFKIAFSACPSDCALAAINDLGFIAHRGPDGSRRFRVVAAGGLATLPTNALVLHESLRAEEILGVAEALVKVFDDTGDRKNRNKARLKFVVRKIGEPAFRALYQAKHAEVEAPKLVIPDEGPPALAEWVLPPLADAGLKAFAQSNVARTRNLGRVFVTIRLPVGDISAAQLFGLAGLSRRFGDGGVRLLVDQNLLLRDVAAGELPELYAALEGLGLATAQAGTSADVTSCPGADSCKLAITHSKGLGQALIGALAEQAVPGISVKLSGCPNSCGQHHIATIGLHGAVRKIGGRAAPHYQIFVGGQVSASGAVFGRPLGKVLARRAGEAVSRLSRFAEERKGPGEEAAARLARAETDELRALLQDLLELSAEQVEERDFVDYGAEAPFQVVTTEGECAA